MELRFNPAERGRISENVARLQSGAPMSDSEREALINQAVGLVASKIPGSDGMTDAERERKKTEDRRASVNTASEIVAPDPDEIDPRAAFDDDDYSDYGDDESYDDNDGEDEMPEDDSSARPKPTVNAELPWRAPAPAPLDLPDDVSTAEPEPVVNDGGAGRVNADGTNRYVDPADDPKNWVQKPGKVSRFLTTWSGLPRAVRLGAPAGAGMLVLALGLSMCSGGSTAPKPDPVSAPPTIAESAAPDESTQTIVLQPTEVTDWCPPRSTSSTFAFIDDKSKAWVCMRDMNTDYARIEIDFGKPVVVQSIKVIPGWDYVEPNGLDHWSEHRLVTAIDWRMGGKLIKQRIDPNRAGSTLTVDDIATQTMAGTVLKSESPPVNPENGGPGLGLGLNTKVDESWAIGKIIVSGYVPGGGG
jgi:hypothetical protein